MEQETILSKYFPYTNRALALAGRVPKWFWLTGIIVLSFPLFLLHGVDRYNMLQAKRLYRQVRTFQLGESAYERALLWQGAWEFNRVKWPESDEFKSECAENNCSIQIEFFSPFGFVLSENSNWLGVTLLDLWDKLSWIGLRPWGAGASISIREGVVVERGFGLGFRKDDKEWFWADVHDVDEMSSPPKRFPGFHIVPRTYKVSWAHLHFMGDTGEVLSAFVSSRGDKEMRSHAWDFDFGCLSGFRKCVGHCDLVPGFWYDQLVHSRSVHPEGASDPVLPECKAAVSKYHEHNHYPDGKLELY